MHPFVYLRSKIMEGTENLHQLVHLLSVVSRAIENKSLHSIKENEAELYKLEAKIIAKLNEKL